MSKHEFEAHVILADGRCRRRYIPGHGLFVRGDALRAIRLYREDAGLNHSAMVDDDDDMEEEAGEDDRHVAFRCRLLHCGGLGFYSLAAYEEHYDLQHRNVCHACCRSFLSARLLDIHIRETHDAFFRILSRRQPMYGCIVDGCDAVFSHGDKRQRHLIRDHQYSKRFAEHCLQTKTRHQKTSSRPTNQNGASSNAQIDRAKSEQEGKKRKNKRKPKTRAATPNMMEVDGGENTIKGNESTIGTTIPSDVMKDDETIDQLTAGMQQLHIPKSISFGRRQRRR